MCLGNKDSILGDKMMKFSDQGSFSANNEANVDESKYDL